MFDLEEINDPLHGLPVLDLLFLAEPPVKPLGKNVGVHHHGPPHHDVAQGRHSLEEGQVLKGPGDSLGRNTVRFHFFGPLFAFKDDAACVGLIKSVDDVQHGGLSCTIRTDDGHDLARVNLQADVIQGHQSAKRDVDIFCAE